MGKMTIYNRYFLLFIFLGVSLLVSMPAQAQSQMRDYRLEKIVDGLDKPWGLAHLPNGDMLFTEWEGDLRYVKNGSLTPDPIAGVPQAYAAGQGGLMDIVLHPNFTHNRLVYLALAVGDDTSNTLRIIRGKFKNGRLGKVQTVFEAAPRRAAPAHYGGRMAFLPDNTLLITVGDGFDHREQAQIIGNHFGAIVRVTDSGKVPSDNPFRDDDTAQPEIWSYGHRNAQAILYDAKTRSVFSNEHGPRGGDELNLIEGGKNYGWPIATYGVNYLGPRVSPYTKYPGTEQPLLHWTPSIAPSGMTLYRGKQFAQWRGDIFVTSLVFNHVVRVDMDGKTPLKDKNGDTIQEILFEEIGARLRDIRTGPDGALYILAEAEGDTAGGIYKVSAK